MTTHLWWHMQNVVAIALLENLNYDRKISCEMGPMKKWVNKKTEVLINVLVEDIHDKKQW